MPEFTKEFECHEQAARDDWKRWLGHLVDQPARGLEIGAYEGRSSLWFLENILTHRNSRLTCVDPFSRDQARLRRFLDNVRDYREKGKLCFVRARSEEFFTRNYFGPPDRYDFVFVDGNHNCRHVLSDSVHSWATLKEGGVLIWDDYSHPVHRGVQEAVTAFLRCYEGRYKLLHTFHVRVSTRQQWQFAVIKTKY